MPKLKLTAIKPPKMPTGEEYAQAMEKAVDKSANLVLRDLQSTVATWTTKPKFGLTILKQGNDYVVTAGTSDVIYGYVNDGTPAHAIKPKRGKYLRFSSGYKAKTRIGIIGSNEGGAFGEDVFSKGVYHPGFIGRRFDLAIQKRRQLSTQQEISQAIAKVNRTK